LRRGEAERVGMQMDKGGESGINLVLGADLQADIARMPGASFWGPAQRSSVAQTFKDAKEIRLGNLAPERDLTFVSDTARAFLLSATARGIEGETIHFGQGAAISVRELAKLCLDVAGRTATVFSVDSRSRPEKSEVGLLLCDPRKAKKLLGWRVGAGSKSLLCQFEMTTRSGFARVFGVTVRLMSDGEPKRLEFAKRNDVAYS
jgi:nucleoside-diphosphate-sugar epimerase